MSTVGVANIAYFALDTNCLSTVPGPCLRLVSRHGSLFSTGVLAVLFTFRRSNSRVQEFFVLNHSDLSEYAGHEGFACGLSVLRVLGGLGRSGEQGSTPC